MTYRLPISVFIIAKNEADRIPIAIASVIDWVEEVIVIDSGSDDDTVSVSESLGARVIFKEWEGYGPQKVFGETLCNNDWLLNIDADEEITPSLRYEIERVFEHETKQCDAYRVPILPIYGFQIKGHPWTAFHKPVRFYKSSKCGFKSEFVHDSVHVPNNLRVGTFKSVVNHRSFRSLVHHIDKVNSYSSAQAEVLYKKGRRTNLITMLILPFFAFWKSYLLRREFVNGIDGILTSHMYAFQRLIRYAKLRELEHKNRDGKN
jgi:glycosyltransferase involved in cell wall biosynthesis